MSPQELTMLAPVFQDPKLHEMLFRYRARNWPESLDKDESARWNEYRTERLTNREAGASITLDQFAKELSQLVVDPSITEEDRSVLDALLDWPQKIGL